MDTVHKNDLLSSEKGLHKGKRSVIKPTRWKLHNETPVFSIEMIATMMTSQQGASFSSHITTVKTESHIHSYIRVNAQTHVQN
uniref:Uncharacterized protein n=1 Tax=Pararge aegeria TaxID=116150 RepID=S4PVD6_9NEOP